MVFAEAEDEVNKRLTKHKQHAKGADLLIYDAQYKENEYQTKLGWGHSYIEYAVDMAIEAGAKILTLFHHDPLRADNQVDDIQQEATRYARE
jgi:ribonuclease BN (tRNA processing enzyme)